MINESKKKDEFLWITNILAPYRLPIIQELSEHYKVTVIAMAESERNRSWPASDFSGDFDLIFVNSKVHYLFDESPLYYSLIKTYNIIKEQDPSVVYLDGYESPAYLSIIYFFRKKNRTLFLLGFRSTENSARFHSRIINRYKFQLINQFDKIVTAGKSSSLKLTNIGIESKKIWELFNPIDVNFFVDMTNRKISATPGHNFLYVGQLIPRKNLKTIIESFAKIARPEDTLRIVGNGDLYDELKRISGEKLLENNIEFLGPKMQKELVDIYAISDTIILVSLSEVWGLVVNEGLAAGLQAVVSKNMGVFELVKNMQGVFECELDVESISNAMSKARASYSGKISSPEILRYSGKKFAQILVDKIKNLH